MLGGMELGGRKHRCQGIEVIEENRMYHSDQIKDTHDGQPNSKLTKGHIVPHN